MNASEFFFMVVCRAEAELATRTLFRTRIAAEDYAAGISESREPLVVSGRFLDLRIDDGRFLEAHE